MSDEIVKLEIDGREVEARKGEMLIRVTDREGVNVPRFCYHDKLSVAANCRMCLVDIEKAPKALPACATPVMDGMKVFTRSERAIAAQKAAMEFLLINHPLDCPICDQGGECELQDLAMGYGSEVSQYNEGKRVVRDKDLGPLISSEMTRCIHCTRCVRFGQEIAGIQELGATGRGEFMTIGTYIEKSIDHELSGNVIDLCPVGALTSKPFRFRARAWEMSQHPTIAPHDGVGSNLHAHVMRGKLMRAVSHRNEPVNETWIADRDRYSYEGVYAADRGLAPHVRGKDGAWRQTDWEDAIGSAVERIRVATGGDFGQLGVIASPNATLEEHHLLAALARELGCANLDHRLRQLDFADAAADPVFPSLGQTVGDLEHNDAVLVIGGHPRSDAPLVAHRLRKAALRGAKISFLNAKAGEYLHPVAEQVVARPSEWIAELGRLRGALDGEGRKTILLGRGAFAHPRFAELRKAAADLAEATGATLAFLPDGANAAGAWLAGMVPHRGPGGIAASKTGMNAREMLENPRRAYILLGTEPELDALLGGTAMSALAGSSAVIVLNPFFTETMREYASVVLPVGTWAETAGTFVNAAGLWQSFNGVAQPVGEARPAWKVLRVLGNAFGLAGFEQQDIQDVQAAVKSQALEAVPGRFKTSIEVEPVEADGLEPVAAFAMYGGDAVVRRAPALQRTAIARADRLVRVHPDDARGLDDGQRVTVSCGASMAECTLAIDSAVAPGAVVLPAATDELAGFDAGAGTVRVEAIAP